MKKNNFLLAPLFTISCVLSLSPAHAASAPAQNITVTVANITNKDITVEIAQNRCAKIVQQIKAHSTPNTTMTNSPATATPIKLTCSLEGIVIKGGPSQINMTVSSAQDLNLLLELDKNMQNILPTYFPVTDIKKWENNRARAQKNLNKIMALNKDKDQLERGYKYTQEIITAAYQNADFRSPKNCFNPSCYNSHSVCSFFESKLSGEHASWLPIVQEFCRYDKSIGRNLPFDANRAREAVTQHYQNQLQELQVREKDMALEYPQ